MEAEVDGGDLLAIPPDPERGDDAIWEEWASHLQG